VDMKPLEATPPLERRGRAWLLWSFLLCPCHLPLTLAALTAVLAGTSLGVALRDHIWLAGAAITIAWLVGTGHGFRLIRQAEKANGACPVRTGSDGSDDMASPRRVPPGATPR
jgi:cytochrome c biogenesis protein CcdA